VIVANTSTVPVTLASGRTLAPGERAETAPNAEESAQIQAGTLTEIPAEDQPASRKARTTTKEAASCDPA
jgi:dihydroorotate dehydrogenase